MKRLTLSSVLFLFACGGPRAPQIAAKGISNNADATNAMAAASSSIFAMNGSAARQISVDTSTNVKAKCDSGTAEATVVTKASIGGAAGTNAATQTYNWKANACKRGDVT